MLGLGLFLIEIQDRTIANHHIHLFRKPEPQKTTFALTLTVKFIITLTLTAKFTFSPCLRAREG